MEEKKISTNGHKVLDADQTRHNSRHMKQRQVRFVEEGVKTQYAGVFNIGFGAEEVLFIFGNPALDPNIVRIESKVAVSLKTAKRLAVMLSNMIRRYETENGVIDLSRPHKEPVESPKLQ